MRISPNNARQFALDLSNAIPGINTEYRMMGKSGYWQDHERKGERDVSHTLSNDQSFAPNFSL